jgi:restriction endonuclease S subunit
VAWYLNLPQTQHYFTQNSGRGVHMPVVRKSVLEDLEVPVPPLATQRRIAGLYRLELEEQELTQALLAKRALLLQAAGLKAAERETP